ncbi:50S ribosomal protein L34e [Candidatus Woesearchaeota archaeon]|nr:50S ribosomal protein L34e [Candidatus Woesearchaeota archaeon]
MPKRSYRSRSIRKIYIKTPGGKTVIHYERKKPKKAHCGSCGAILKGVPRERPYKLRKLAKTQRRPERPYGGVLCSKCARLLFIREARK